VRIPGPNEPLNRQNDAIRDLATGGTNASNSFTLVVGATATPVQDDLCTAASMIVLSPRTAAAAASGAWISGTQNGSFIVGHPAAAAGCLFDYEIRRREAAR
jgi:hypothetical protein